MTHPLGHPLPVPPPPDPMDFPPRVRLRSTFGMQRSVTWYIRRMSVCTHVCMAGTRDGMAWGFGAAVPWRPKLPGSFTRLVAEPTRAIGHPTLEPASPASAAQEARGTNTTARLLNACHARQAVTSSRFRTGAGVSIRRCCPCGTWSLASWPRWLPPRPSSFVLAHITRPTGRCGLLLSERPVEPPVHLPPTVWIHPICPSRPPVFR